jgi:membrane-bound lytic murein transglycosylase MltF
VSYIVSDKQAWGKTMLKKKTQVHIGLCVALLAALSVVITVSETSAVESILRHAEKRLGDFDNMAEENVIRALVPYSKTFYFLDGADQRGLTYELLQQFEKYINKKLKRKTIKVRVVVIPTKRDRLLPDLREGRGDIAAGNLTITQQRLQQVDFAAPLLSGVDEILVSGPGSPQVTAIDDLAGQEIHVRASSSYYASLQQLNAEFKKAGKKQVKLILADELFEDEDLLEMMNAGLIPMIVIDSHKGAFWMQVFPKLRLHPEIKLRTGGRIAWAMRKKSPQLTEVINAFVKSHKKGTLTGNILFKRYLQDTKWVRNSLGKEEIQRFEQALEFFKKYSTHYNFDWLMVAALAYQESGIDQSKRSSAGAVGVMQMLPSTAADRNVNIQNIEKMENNIHAGVKYLRFIRDRYFEKEPMDDLNKMLFSFASYNAGAAKIARLRKEAQNSGLDPNIWFRNVEIIAAKRIGRETVTYVSNIYKYYAAYRLILNKLEMKEEVKKKAS